jgi:tRNA pseudouridine38-40 synthase
MFGQLKDLASWEIGAKQELMRYKLTLAYDGTGYAGWQEQREERTLQGEFQEALRILEDRRVVTHAAGRTDAGVHAAGQVVSFDLDRVWRGEVLRRALNGNLPGDIRVLDAGVAGENFHPRVSARRKTYRYQIFNGPVMSPFLRHYAWHVPYSLDDMRLEQDAHHLIGRHDYRAFTVTSCETKTTVRTIESIVLQRDGGLLHLSFTGDGFLRYQVRTMVAALLEVNRGRRGGGGVDSMAKLLASGDRSLIGIAAPACGLTLMKVEY